ncbi:hypothetical protein, partial [Tropheryma whipplei]
MDTSVTTGLYKVTITA